MTPEEYGKVLMEDLRIIHEWAEGVALLPGWQRSKGARAEEALATALGRDVWSVRGWLGPWRPA